MSKLEIGKEVSRTRVCWFVGASFGGTDDQTSRFISEGIWENNYKNKYLEIVKSVKPGERIAIKSSYTRKHGLPFDNRGHMVSVMAIKATGIVMENIGDGRNLKVDWEQVVPPREWFFYTHRITITRIMPGDWATDALISFTFDGVPQDLDRFRNHPFWRERFGDKKADDSRFNWTKFYEAFADKLLLFKNRREELVAGMHEIASRLDNFTSMTDQFADGSTGPLKDICPFTIIGTFNRGLTDKNRTTTASELANFFGVIEPLPVSFDGIPTLNNQSSWFFGYSKRREQSDIDNLWDVFEAALKYADSDDADSQSNFICAYDETIKAFGVGWNLSVGLYWIRPWYFPTLDSQSRNYIKNKLNIEIGLTGPKARSSGTDYIELTEKLTAHFEEEAYPVHSFPELSYNAWLAKDTAPSDDLVSDPDQEEDIESEGDPNPAPIQPYSLENIIEDGCFVEQERLEEILERFRTKKNLILQGPPGTGKTWLAKKIAFALIGQLDEKRIRVVQFHPNLSYEDFIRGWRPQGDGKLSLVDGPFLEMIKLAKNDPRIDHVMVIEEINRGNPAQIFGEMLTLLEADKRTPAEAMELCYRRSENERVHIPDNIYVIGTMNIADRSLALVDYALRRRFAFITLEPIFGNVWLNWVHSKCNMPVDILKDIERRINALNENIANHVSLGPQFRIGHSYVTPSFMQPINDARRWFMQVVKTEIGPLLEEYWFDLPEEAKKAREKLLEGF